MRSTLIEALVDSLTSAFSYGYTFPAKLRGYTFPAKLRMELFYLFMKFIPIYGNYPNSY